MKFKYPVINLLMVLALVFTAFIGPSNSVIADGTAQSLPFSQNWTNTSLITTNDDWSAVPGIVGYLGDYLPTTTPTGVDPQTILNEGVTSVDVIANQTNPNTLTAGGVAEFEITNPVVALQGSGTADAPYILINLNTTGKSNIQVAYNVRDIDGSADNAIQPVALHYRVGNTGAWTNIAAAFIADATTGPSLAILVTPVSVLLPSDANNQPLVQIRVITTNAAGSDEWVGIDDITITEEIAPTILSTTPANGATYVLPTANILVNFSEPVNVTGTWFSIACTDSSTHTAQVSGGPQNFTLNPDVDFAMVENCTVTIIATQVTDQDSNDPPDNMAVDYLWSYSVDANDPAPVVSSTVPVNAATDVSLSANLTITFSEPVNVTGSWYGITCGSSGVHSVVVTGGPTTFTLNPDVNFVHGETCTVTLDKDLITDVDVIDPYDAMLAPYTWSFKTYLATCTDPIGTYPLKTIGEVQGTGTVSPYIDLKVTVRGTVTGDYQTSAKMSGYFLQAADDGDLLTSDAIFVYSNTPDVNVGDAVQFSGTVTEYNGLTEIQIKSGSSDPGGTLCGTSIALPAPVELTLPQATTASFEPYEAQLVTITNTTLFVDQNYFQGRYGQVTLSSGSRMYNPTNGNGLGDTVDLNARRMIVLDDGSTAQNVNPPPYYDLAYPLRAGDTVTGGLTGFMDQGAINSTSPYILGYRVHATVAPTFNQVNLRPTAPPAYPPVGVSDITVVGMNLYNYFTTIDASPYPVGSPYYYNSSTDNNTPRGADSTGELTRQTDKFVSLIHTLNPDIFGVDEMEKWEGADPADTHFMVAINTGLADPYAIISDPALGFGGDAIKNTIYYKPSKVTPVGGSVSYNIPDVTRPGYDLFDRYPIAQTFQSIQDGQIFTVIINHFKSKGCGGATGDELDTGQGCWNAKRVRQANALLDFKNQLITSTGDADVIFIGDYNAYGAEDPINVFTVAGMEDLMKRVPAETRYSYIFDGQAGYLDHAIVTPSLGAIVKNIMPWHINADEATLIDYDLNYNQPGYYTTEPYRASDHDPIWVKLNVNDAPTLAGTIPNQETLSYKPYTYTFGAGLATDVDVVYGDVLTYSATLVDGSPLPAWLSFDPATRTFSGVPGKWDTRTWQIKVTATDNHAAFVSTTFDLKVTLVFYFPLISK